MIVCMVVVVVVVVMVVVVVVGGGVVGGGPCASYSTIKLGITHLGMNTAHNHIASQVELAGLRQCPL